MAPVAPRRSCRTCGPSAPRTANRTTKSASRAPGRSRNRTAVASQSARKASPSASSGSIPSPKRASAPTTASSSAPRSRQPVHPRPGVRAGFLGDETGRLQPTEPVGQQVRRHARQPQDQLAVPARPGEQLAHHQQRPAVADDVQGGGDGTELLVGTRHGVSVGRHYARICSATAPGASTYGAAVARLHGDRRRGASAPQRRLLPRLVQRGVHVLPRPLRTHSHTPDDATRGPDHTRTVTDASTTRPPPALRAGRPPRLAS